jgi:uncharacterized protein YegJ (DUF2314 family)
MVYKNNPALALLPKAEDFYGKYKPIPMIFGTPQGRSASFSQAQARSQLTYAQTASMLLTRVANYSIANISNEVLLASQNNVGAFMDAAKLEMDGAIRASTNDLATSLFKSGYGEVAQIADVTNKVITLANVNDIVYFEVGMELMVVNGAVVTNALRALAGSDGLIVTSIDRSLGTLTFAAANVTATIPATTIGDWLSVRGDRQAGAYTTQALPKVAGFSAWIPTVAPSAGESFFGVDRSVDSRLHGQVFNGAGLPIEESLIELSALIGREGGAPDYAFVNFKTYAALEKALGSKIMYVDLKVAAAINFTGIKIYGANGPITVLADRSVPDKKVYMLQMDSWKLNSLGKAVRILDTDGLTWLRSQNADNLEIRIGGYLNCSCNAPAYQGIVLL